MSERMMLYELRITDSQAGRHDRILSQSGSEQGTGCLLYTSATQEIYKQCIQLGYTEIFIDAGCVVSTPTCGPCLGGYMGILAENERCVATTNRNFVGRMGHVDSEVYLASPAVAAASAIMGRIAAPKEVA